MGRILMAIKIYTIRISLKSAHLHHSDKGLGGGRYVRNGKVQSFTLRDYTSHYGTRRGGADFGGESQGQKFSSRGEDICHARSRGESDRAVLKDHNSRRRR